MIPVIPHLPRHPTLSRWYSSDCCFLENGKLSGAETQINFFGASLRPKISAAGRLLCLLTGVCEHGDISLSPMTFWLVDGLINYLEEMTKYSIVETLQLRARLGNDNLDNSELAA
jgi:hypothetical protein